MVPLGILVIVLVVLFEVYKTSFEHWVSPLTDWLRKREAWSWVIPVSILFILSFPPLFGHEVVQLIVGVSTGRVYSHFGKFHVLIHVDSSPILLGLPLALLARVQSWERLDVCESLFSHCGSES
jgi:hypothetical protein